MGKQASSPALLVPPTQIVLERGVLSLEKVKTHEW